MKANNTDKLNVIEGNNPTVLVITDLVTEGCYERNMVMSVPAMALFAKEAKLCGFDPEQFVFVTPCPPVPLEEDEDMTDSKAGQWLADHREEFLGAIARYENKVGCVVTLGKWGLRQLHGRAVQITKSRGTVKDIVVGATTLPLLPLLSPKEVLRFPDRREVYNTDFMQLRALQQEGWNVEGFRSSSEDGFEWCLDLQPWLDNPPACIFADLETIGNDMRAERFSILTFAFSDHRGKAYVVPLDVNWWNDATLFSHASASAERLTKRKRAKLLKQIQQLVGNPQVHCVGHNFKYDIHGLRWAGITVANWYADTMQLAFVVDENMQSKAQDDCIRRWQPQYAGYADEFNAKVDKSRMHTVEHEDFLSYAGGDVAYGYPLTQTLLALAKADKRQWDTFTKVQMPTLRTFVEMEKWGVRIDTEALATFGAQCENSEAALYAELMEQVPPAVLRAHAEAGWKFSRADFVIDILFGPDAIRFNESGDIVTGPDRKKGTIKLKPTVFTKGGKPSTSTKQHLPYFDHLDFVSKLMQYQKLSKMRSTYVGHDAFTEVRPVKLLKNGGLPKPVADALVQQGLDPKEIPNQATKRRRTPVPALEAFCRGLGDNANKPIKDVAVVVPYKKNSSLQVTPFGGFAEQFVHPETGFWQYLKDREFDPAIHPSFWLHRTNTGRAASSDPNGQNFPKRGSLAKAYRKIFVPRPGYIFIEADLSQAELRIAAWMADETEMLRIYSEGGDIHASTAAATMGISEAQFNAGLLDSTPLADVMNDWPGAANYLQGFDHSIWHKVKVGHANEDEGEFSFLGYKRFSAKAVNFGFIYGMGWRKFKVYARTDYGINYTDDEAKAVREAFFAKYPRLEAWHKAMRKFVEKHGYVRALHGALRRLDNIESDDDGIVGATSRQAINAPVQRFASDIGLIALCRFVRDANPDDMRPVLFIHDANIIEARLEVADEAAMALRYYMQTAPLAEWFGLHAPLPLTADVSMGTSLGAMQERPDLIATAPEWFRRGEFCDSLDAQVQAAHAFKKRRGIIVTH